MAEPSNVCCSLVQSQPCREQTLPDALMLRFFTITWNSITFGDAVMSPGLTGEVD